MYNVPIIVCGSMAERGLDEERGATRATCDVIFLMLVVSYAVPYWEQMFCRALMCDVGV